MRVVTFKIDESWLEELDKYARMVGKTRSEVIREAIIEHLKRNWRTNTSMKPKIIRIFS